MDIKAVRLNRLRKLVADRYEGNAGRCADFMGMKRPQINRWLTHNDEARQGISEESARDIEKKHGLPSGWLDVDPQTELLQHVLEDSDFVSIRRVHFKLSAGISGYSVEHIDGTKSPIFFRHDWIDRRGYKPDYLYAIEVSGASMEPGLYDEDMVVINTLDNKPEDGQVFAFNYEGELVIKRLKRDSGEWWLSSDNNDKRRYPDKRCDENVFILGRIIHKQSERL